MKQYLLQQILPLLFSITSKIQANSDKQFQPLTTRQFMTLMTIVHIPPNECTLNRIALHMGTTKQNIAQIVDSLMKGEMLEITENPNDRRSKLIQVNEAGMKQLQQSSIVANQIIDDMGKSFTQEDLYELHRLLSKLYRYDDVSWINLHKEDEL